NDIVDNTVRPIVDVLVPPSSANPAVPGPETPNPVPGAPNEPVTPPGVMPVTPRQPGTTPPSAGPVVPGVPNIPAPNPGSTQPPANDVPPVGDIPGSPVIPPVAPSPGLPGTTLPEIPATTPSPDALPVPGPFANLPVAAGQDSGSPVAMTVVPGNTAGTLEQPAASGPRASGPSLPSVTPLITAVSSITASSGGPGFAAALSAALLLGAVMLFLARVDTYQRRPLSLTYTPVPPPA